MRGNSDLIMMYIFKYVFTFASDYPSQTLIKRQNIWILGYFNVEM